MKLMLLIALSFIGDFFWLCLWTPHWWGAEQRKYQVALHTFVIICSFANWIMKLAVLAMLYVKKGSDLNNLMGRIKNQGK